METLNLRQSNLNILYVNSSSFPIAKASSVQIMQMCEAFASLGNSVKLVSLQPNNKPLSTTKIQKYYGVSSNFTIQQLSRKKLPRKFDLFQIQAIRNNRLNTHICYSRGRDIIAPTIGLQMGMHAIIEVHGKPLSLKEKMLLKLIQSHRRGMLVTISDALRKLYINELNFSDKNIIVATGGVDINKFDPYITIHDARQKLNMEEGTWIIYTGGLYRGRGLDFLFKAVTNLDIKVMIVGGSNDQQIKEWQYKAKKQNLNNIYFTGYQSPETIPLYLAAANMLIMPYETKVYTANNEETSSWASPLKLYEYMAASRPIIASNIPMIKNTLIDNHNSLLVEPCSATAIRKAIKTLVNNDKLGNHIATNARKDVLKHTWTTRAQHIINNVGKHTL